MKHIALLLLATAACSTGGVPNVTTPKHREPKSDAKRYLAKNGWDIKSKSDIPDIGKVSESGGVIIWDLQGAILDGKNQKGKLDDNESNEPMFRARVPLIVKNGFATNVKNAMSFFAKDSGVERMTFTQCGEDCVGTAKGRLSSVRAYGFIIRDSEFIGRLGADKLAQANEAKDARIEGNLFYSNITAIRIGDSDTTEVSDMAVVKGNRFLGNDTGINASRITVKESENKYESVNTPWKASNGAVKK